MLMQVVGSKLQGDELHTASNSRPSSRNSRPATTIQTRQLGRHLRELRRQAQLSAESAADHLRVHPVTVYRYEAGKSIPRPPDVAALCAIYGADPATTEALTALAQEADATPWWRSYTGAIPRWFDTYVALEAAASLIRWYDAQVIPGLLQTRDYAHAILNTGAETLGITPEEAEDRINVRLRRQSILSRPAATRPTLQAIIGEQALTLDIAHPVMDEQLLHLDAMSRKPNVTVRILPSSIPHAALSAGARFAILTFPTGKNSAEPPLAYSETLCGAIYLDKPAELESYNAVWEAINSSALSPADSRDLINSMMTSRDKP